MGERCAYLEVLEMLEIPPFKSTRLSSNGRPARFQAIRENLAAVTRLVWRGTPAWLPWILDRVGVAPGDNQFILTHFMVLLEHI